MTPDIAARATWHQNSPSTMVLKCCAKDGGAVLATICEAPDLTWHWSAGAQVGTADTRYAAQRRARAALREEIGR